MYGTLAILAGFAFVYSVVASRVERTPVSGAVVFLAFGILAGPEGLLCRSIRSSWSEAISAGRPEMHGSMGRAASDAGSFDRRCGRRAPLSVVRRLVRCQSEERETGGCSGGPSVSVVKTANLGLSHDPALARWLDLPRPGGVPVEGLVGPRVVVIHEVLT